MVHRLSDRDPLGPTISLHPDGQMNWRPSSHLKQPEIPEECPSLLLVKERSFGSPTISGSLKPISKLRRSSRILGLGPVSKDHVSHWTLFYQYLHVHGLTNNVSTTVTRNFNEEQKRDVL